MFEVTRPCSECEGDGQRIIGHPNDPSAKVANCLYCSDGTETFKVDLYDTVDQVREDYNNAIEIKEKPNE